MVSVRRRWWLGIAAIRSWWILAGWGVCFELFRCFFVRLVCWSLISSGSIIAAWTRVSSWKRNRKFPEYWILNIHIACNSSYLHVGTCICLAGTESLCGGLSVNWFFDLFWKPFSYRKPTFNFLSNVRWGIIVLQKSHSKLRRNNRLSVKFFGNSVPIFSQCLEMSDR